MHSLISFINLKTLTLTCVLTLLCSFSYSSDNSKSNDNTVPTSLSPTSSSDSSISNTSEIEVNKDETKVTFKSSPRVLVEKTGSETLNIKPKVNLYQPESADEEQVLQILEIYGWLMTQQAGLSSLNFTPEETVAILNGVQMGIQNQTPENLMSINPKVNPYMLYRLSKDSAPTFEKIKSQPKQKPQHKKP